MTQLPFDITVGITQPELYPLNPVVGLDSKDIPVLLDLDRHHPTATILGNSGSGKTVLLYNILYSAMLHSNPKCLRLVLIDGKNGSFGTLPDMPFALYAIDGSKHPKNAVDAIYQVKEIVKDRLNKLAAGKPDTSNQTILLIVDEYSTVFDQAEAADDVRDDITYIMHHAGETNVRVILSNRTETLTGEEFEPRVLLRGGGQLAEGFEPGDFVTFDRDFRGRVQGKSIYLSDEDVEKLNEHIRETYVD